VKSNISAKLVALIKDKILVVQAPFVALFSMSACASRFVRRSKSLLVKMLGDRFVVQHFEVLVSCAEIGSLGVALPFRPCCLFELALLS
jgi:hypothetical protein